MLCFKHKRDFECFDEYFVYLRDKYERYYAPFVDKCACTCTNELKPKRRKQQ